VSEFSAFTGLRGRVEQLTVTRAHVIAWRKDLETWALSPASPAQALGAILAVRLPVRAQRRFRQSPGWREAPARGDAQARKLLEAPPEGYPQGCARPGRPATLLYHSLRREELCSLRVRDMQSRRGVLHFRVKGKRGKVRFVPAHAMTQRLMEEYLALAGHGSDAAGPLFRSTT
jgi:integrase/recombinase XerD